MRGGGNGEINDFDDDVIIRRANRIAGRNRCRIVNIEKRKRKKALRTISEKYTFFFFFYQETQKTVDYPVKRFDVQFTGKSFGQILWKIFVNLSDKYFKDKLFGNHGIRCTLHRSVVYPLEQVDQKKKKKLPIFYSTMSD